MARLGWQRIGLFIAFNGFFAASTARAAAGPNSRVEEISLASLCEFASGLNVETIVSEVTGAPVTLKRYVFDPLEDLEPRAVSPRTPRPLMFFLQGFAREPELFRESKLYKIYLEIWRGFDPVDVPRIVILGWGGLAGLVSEISEQARRDFAASFMAPAQLKNWIQDFIQQFPFATSRKVLVGGSMGAANAMLLVREMPRYFDGIVVYALPVLEDYQRDVVAASETDFAPARWAGQEPVLASEVVAKLLRHDRVAPLLRYLFSTEAQWNRFSALALLRHRELPESLRETPIYMTVGRQDALGYFPAAEILARELKAQGFRIEWSPAEGGHGGPYDTPTILRRVSGIEN